MTMWYEKQGPSSDTVVSTRVRLARNIKNYPFPANMDAAARKAFLTQMRELSSKMSDKLGNLKYFSFDDLSDTRVACLVEQHFISPEFASETADRGLLLDEEAGVSIMLCEEDHMRLQCLVPGLALEEAFSEAMKLDDLFSAELPFSFDDRFGYLTSCPTNLGTAMRASVMLHLPALTMTGAIEPLAQNIAKIGLTIRGRYGEGSKAAGCLYQISNQVTLGLSEQETLKKLSDAVTQLVELERKARENIFRENEIMLRDRTGRALGTARSAWSMPSDEAVTVLSDIRLGAECGLLDAKYLAAADASFIDVTPAMMQSRIGAQSNPAARDSARAEMLRSRFA